VEAYAGARLRYGLPLPGEVVKRLEHELESIDSKGFSPYFLVVRDIVTKRPRICGRGSGAASLVAYCLGITNVCPVKHNLYFERFLNPGRKDPPDIDVDFAWDERDGVINSVLERYKGRSAMVCNHVLFQPRMAIRETAKVFGIPEGEISKVTKRLPWMWSSVGESLRSAIESMPQKRGVEFREPWPEILDLAQRIIGTPRHLSVHPGGLVITPGPIDEHAPVEISAKGVPIVQWEKDGTEEAGLVKIDLLGNRSLAVIRDAIANVRENGMKFDELRWEPEDDPATREAVAKGKTMGCFYIESPAMRLLQERSGRGDFEHLVIHSSIIRPAANEYIREYLRRLHGGGWEPLHPLLEETLRETYGIMVYQEDVSRVAVDLAGFWHEGADMLRKILSRKDRERRLAALRERFVKGAREKGVADGVIEKIWKMIMSFDGYSFCKPHSASYARVSYQSAYLKAHYPAQFMAAVISNRGGFYSTFAYVSEARRLGCEILPPDMNESEVCWKGLPGKKIRAGLMSVKGLSRETQERTVSERGRGAYKDFADFLERVRPHEDEARAMIFGGACGAGQGGLLWQLDAWKHSVSTGFTRALSVPPPVLPPDDAMELLRRQFATLGFLCDRHPITLFEDALQRYGVVKAEELRRYAGRRVRIAGWLITGKMVSTKHGEPMEFLTFEDETGLVETTFFPEAYDRFCRMLDADRPYILEGRVEEEFGAVTLTVDRVKRVSRRPIRRAPPITSEGRGEHRSRPGT